MSFKICTVGCGGMSSEGHGPSHAQYAASHPGTILAACCDLDEEKAIRYRDKFGYKHHYTDFVKMLDVEKSDAVCLIVRVPQTCDISCRVLEMGYPLMMEKPPGRSMAELDRMIAAADASGAAAQVAFNRRYMPLVREAKRILAEETLPAELQHIYYEVTRVGRTEPDFSVTAIHGIDTVRFLAGCDYEHIRFRYREFPHIGPGVANIFLDCVFTSGVTAHLSFCPVSGTTFERATLHAWDNSLFLSVPYVREVDFPGILQHYQKGALKRAVSGAGEWYQINGFYAENEAFFDDIRNGRRPSGDLRSARQSVRIAECIRERREEYRLA